MPTDLINPYSALPVPHRCSKARSIFLQAVRPAPEFLERWTQDGKLQPEVANKVKEWFSVRTKPDGSAKAWATGTSAATRRISGLKFLTRRANFLCGWTRRGLPGVAQNLLDKRGEDYAAYMANPALEQYHFIGKDIVTFHTLFWPAMLHIQRPKDA
jgi:methionyl-tRNA synthetase